MNFLWSFLYILGGLLTWCKNLTLVDYVVNPLDTKNQTLQLYLSSLALYFWCFLWFTDCNLTPKKTIRATPQSRSARLRWRPRWIYRRCLLIWNVVLQKEKLDMERSRSVGHIWIISYNIHLIQVSIFGLAYIPSVTGCYYFLSPVCITQTCLVSSTILGHPGDFTKESLHLAVLTLEIWSFFPLKEMVDMGT